MQLLVNCGIMTPRYVNDDLCKRLDIAFEAIITIEI